MDWSSVAAAVVPTVLAFVWSKLRGEQTQSYTDTIKGIGKQLVHELVILGTQNSADLNLRAQAFMGFAMARLKVPTNAVTTAIVNATIEHAIGDALAELRAIDNANDALAELAARTQHAADGIAAAEARGKAQAADAEYAAMIERVPPDSPATSTPTKDAQP